ncbi:adenylate/guanylate cyclase domain-containing protein [Sinorhizobium medicae]|uniref:Adenylate/guanylate cyclase domain-containing protein n=3 Tax=Sinorhizobium medicae TaxID=110321 RepID=A0A508WZR4_9HYPH|nr:adenylate/guanylate cyclase domain-containing protein [Sinorhizobium medicae]ABR60794.1 putative adenylate/guanylate cyclase [Sinorhizobium medicae WSM419]MBO1964965.1 adenylate/guanylate cyclase domain-containing protein [Sinorhizobium medicae]MDX0406952.1 adenylate/guanylate cyclase domain-containing protein [Sinorhizobium medicae]MDX0412621.1 adenylate/guanylate cyclase domain-containing protein [Sinorhizobium medicae]MDX0418662.1 adenylate/guanylate cyclase domain-containing protein [Si
MSRTRRKLTTIFCADVQDYSRLMGKDEEGTLAALKRSRDAMARLIEAHEGRVVNTWGDGLIAEFPSVVEAVRAAIDVQNELAGLNAGRPSEARMDYRIGINLGDVIADGDDLYGDGVNIAARLQGSAPAGGIVISSTVYDQVRNKLAVGFEFLGALTVKNIDGGVPSYAVQIGAAEGPGLPEASGGWGRQGAPSDRENLAADTGAEGVPAGGLSRTDRRIFGVLGVAAAGVVAINFASWEGEFWARWPLFAFALIAVLRQISGLTQFDRGLALLGAVGSAAVAVNLLSWEGRFWAIWPVLGIAVAAGIRWAVRGSAR